jgi:2-polyprenyl-3-methyl-5-hydroxy-6-metoxy-1,4-benzoquinol methylase
MTSRETYTHGHSDAVLRSHRWRTVENSASYLAALLEPGMSLLDVGCGPGTITADFAERLAPGPVVGIDSAAAVVDAAADEHRAPNLTFRTADVYHLDEVGQRYDVVHAHQVLQHLADPVAALAQMGRACRPGGIVAARDAVYSAMTWWPDFPGLHRWLEVYRAVARANGGEPDAGRNLLAWAHAAGFADVTVSATVWCFATPEDRLYWAGTWAARTTSSAMAERAVELGLATPTELEECARAWREWAASPDGWFAVLHGEVLARA